MTRARRGDGPRVGRAGGDRSGGDPLAGVERVLVDGSNLAYALARPAPVAGTTSERGAAAAPRPAVAVIAALRATFPPRVRVEVVFDGAGPGAVSRPGTPARGASNLFVEHSGRRAADRVIEEAVAGQLAADGPAGTWGILVVTDDRELRGLVQARGARVAGTAWLAGRLARVGGGHTGGGTAGRPGAAIGHGRPPRRPRC